MRDLSIRSATPRDATDLAAMIDMTGHGLPLYLWSEMAVDGQSPFEIGRARSMREVGALSFRNASVAQVGGEFAGAVISYELDNHFGSSSIDSTHEIAQPLVRLEAQVPGHRYINALAVYSEYRRQGIGARLLRHAEMLGYGKDRKGTALIVASKNLGAKALYERAGYRKKASLPIVSPARSLIAGEWVLLTKPHP